MGEFRRRDRPAPPHFSARLAPLGRANPSPAACSGSRPSAPEPSLRRTVAVPRVTRTGTQLSSDSTDAAQLGRVVGHFGLAVEVLVADGERRRIRVTRGAPSLVVGDRVRVSSAGPVLLPRDTVLQRRDARGRSRVIAANLNVLGISIAAQPAAPAGYVDCAIVAARAAGIDPVHSPQLLHPMETMAIGPFVSSTKIQSAPKSGQSNRI